MGRRVERMTAEGCPIGRPKKNPLGPENQTPEKKGDNGDEFMYREGAIMETNISTEETKIQRSQQR